LCCFEIAMLRAVTIDEAFQEAGVGYGSFLMILISGMIFCADSAEVSLVTYMIKNAQESFALSDAEVILLEQVTFAGQILGPVFWGRLADCWGRRPAILFCGGVVMGFGVITACAQTFLQLMIARFVVGFGISGIFLSLDIACELVPKESAGKLSSSLNFFWPFGSVFTILCAYLFLETFGWRALACCVTLPMFSALGLAYAFLPESPYWLLEQGREDEAMQSITQIAELNGVKLSFNALQSPRNSTMPIKASSSKSVWKQQQRTLLILMSLWLFMSMNYLCIVLLGPMLLTKTVLVADHGETNVMRQEMDFFALSISSCSEIISVTLCVLLLDRWGRRHFQASFYALAGLVTFFLSFRDQLPYPAVALLVIVIRCTIFSAGCGSWLHTPEAFPVQIRATGHAVCNLMANVGRVLAPLLVSHHFSAAACSCIMASTLLGVAVLALSVPETASQGTRTEDFDPSSYKALRPGAGTSQQF